MVGSEPAASKECSHHVVVQISEHQRGAARVFQPSVDRLGWPVTSVAMIEVRQDVVFPALERTAEAAQLLEHGSERRRVCRSRGLGVCAQCLHSDVGRRQ